MDNVTGKIIENKKKIYKLERKEEILRKCAIGGFTAIFITGVPAVVSLVTGAYTGVALGAYAASNVFMAGSLIYGVNVESRKRDLISNNKLLKEHVQYIAKQTETTLYDKNKKYDNLNSNLYQNKNTNSKPKVLIKTK